MIKRLVIVTGLAVALAGGSTIALAQGPQGGMGRGFRGGPRADLGLRGITLDEAQRTQVRAILESHQTALREAEQKLREARRAFDEAARAASVDEAAIRAQSTALANAMAQHAIVRANIRAEVHNLLTVEQKQQLEERRAAMQKRMEERKKRMEQRRQQRRQP